MTFADVTEGGQNINAAKNQHGDPGKWKGPEKYTDAARYIHELVESIVPNRITRVMGGLISFIDFTNLDEPFIAAPATYADFYPGDDYLDRHAMTLYSGLKDERRYAPFSGKVEPLWSEIMGVDPTKPVRLVEFGIIENFGNRSKWFNDFFQKVKTITGS